jgi:hypothetical protein
MRTFASKTDRDLVIGTSVATVAVTIILTLVGATGLLLPGQGHGQEIQLTMAALRSFSFSSSFRHGL